jgi:predicted phosphodiesterase
MLLAIFSDIHANFTALEKVYQFIQKIKPDLTIFLGDAVGYGASPRECIQLLSEWKGLLAVQGNHDRSVAGDFIGLEGYSPRALASLIWTQKILHQEEKIWLQKLPLRREINNLGFTHASWTKAKSFPYLIHKWQVGANLIRSGPKIVFTGHTHKTQIWTIKNHWNLSRKELCPQKDLILPSKTKILIQSGTVGYLPQSDAAADILLYDTKKQMLRQERISFDPAGELEKIERLIRKKNSSKDDNSDYKEIEIPRIL